MDVEKKACGWLYALVGVKRFLESHSAARNERLGRLRLHQVSSVKGPPSVLYGVGTYTVWVEWPVAFCPFPGR